MALVDFEWLPRLPVGFMEEDHKDLALFLNDLAEAILAYRSGNEAWLTVATCWRAIETLLRVQCARAEDAMARFGHADTKAHRAQHAALLAAVEEESRAFEGRADVQRLYSFVTVVLPAWMREHVAMMDLPAARYLASKEAEAALEAERASFWAFPAYARSVAESPAADADRQEDGGDIASVHYDLAGSAGVEHRSSAAAQPSVIVAG